MGVSIWIETLWRVSCVDEKEAVGNEDSFKRYHRRGELLILVLRYY